ncbi:MAG: stage V sporulation protein AC [Faecousia sp.]
MDMNQQEYSAYVQSKCPKSPILRDCFNAFWIGGLICVLGQCFINGYQALGLAKKDCPTAASMTLVVLSILLTGFSLYDNIAKVAGAGTLVPITGFANSIAAPAIEFKSEGIVTGTCVKLFTIAGPVLVFGLGASVIYGFIYWVCQML